MSIIQTAGSFIPDLKTDPNIFFSKFREILFQEAMNTENAILEQYGLLLIFLSNAEWEALLGNFLHAAVHAVPACRSWLAELPLLRQFQLSIVTDTIS